VTKTITIEHNGKTYYGQAAKIDSTHLGSEDHGITTAFLHCSWKGGAVGVGGFCLDVSTGKPDYKRRGTAYGLDHILRLMETVGVNRWEDLPGKQVIVLFQTENHLGSTSAGIANVLNDEVLILKEHAEHWLGPDDR
jgi:hypothetical protein